MKKKVLSMVMAGCMLLSMPVYAEGDDVSDTLKKYREDGFVIGADLFAPYIYEGDDGEMTGVDYDILVELDFIFAKAMLAKEMDAVRPMIDAARAKLTGSAPVSSDIDISAEINAEKNRII